VTPQAIALLVAIYVANWISAKYAGFPFLYCWGAWVIAPAYEPWAFLVNFAALAYFAYMVSQFKFWSFVQGFCAALFVYSIPVLADGLFRIGGSCGG
jgi:hypothetical protein